MQTPGKIPPGTDFVWEQAERRVDAQLRQADALDSKAGILVGIHALAAGLVASVFTWSINLLAMVALTVGIATIVELVQ